MQSSNDHSFKRYDQELEEIRTRVLQMGGLVELQIHDSIRALCDSDLGEMERIAKNDHSVNAQEVEIDQSCALIIARRQPTAGDLRMLMGISKIVTDLERCGDKAALISRKAKIIFANGKTNVPCLADIRDLSEMAIGLLRTALNAFARQDAVTAATIVLEDEAIDQKFKAITRQLITFIMEDPQLITISFEILFIAKAVERVGDHAKNIAEQIIYITRGTDVRHVSFDQLEREAQGKDEAE